MTIALFCFLQTGSYVLIQQFSLVNARSVELAIDSYIPFIPFFSLPYVLFYVYLPSVPLYISFKSNADFKKYKIVWILTLAICSLIHVLYPTYIIRAQIHGTDIFSRFVAFIYSVDGITNCMPSVHCATAWLAFIGIRHRNEIKPLIKFMLCLLSLCICFSTVLIKQHWVIDILSAVAIVELVWFAVGKVQQYQIQKKTS